MRLLLAGAVSPLTPMRARSAHRLTGGRMRNGTRRWRLGLSPRGGVKREDDAGENQKTEQCEDQDARQRKGELGFEAEGREIEQGGAHHGRERQREEQPAFADNASGQRTDAESDGEAQHAPHDVPDQFRSISSDAANSPTESPSVAPAITAAVRPTPKPTVGFVM